MHVSAMLSCTTLSRLLEKQRVAMHTEDACLHHVTQTVESL